MTLKQAVESAMKGKRRPMTVAEIAEVALPLAELRGAPPKQTLYSILYAENRKADGLVERTGKGTFGLRRTSRRKAA
jgi:hypothetical protein